MVDQIMLFSLLSNEFIHYSLFYFYLSNTWVFTSLPSPQVWYHIFPRRHSYKNWLFKCSPSAVPQTQLDILKAKVSENEFNNHTWRNLPFLDLRVPFSLLTVNMLLSCSSQTEAAHFFFFGTRLWNSYLWESHVQWMTVGKAAHDQHPHEVSQVTFMEMTKKK